MDYQNDSNSLNISNSSNGSNDSNNKLKNKLKNQLKKYFPYAYTGILYGMYLSFLLGIKNNKLFWIVSGFLALQILSLKTKIIASSTILTLLGILELNKRLKN